MLTVILQASQLKSLVTGEEHPTVITLEMALYKKAVQLLDSRDDLKRTVLPRLGELHTVMAALRTLGTSIENSGIDDAWIEADVYGSATTRHILKCAHYMRTLRAHIHMYTALFELNSSSQKSQTPNPSAQQYMKVHRDIISALMKLTEGRRPNAGGEGCIGQLCMLTVLPKGHPYNKYS